MFFRRVMTQEATLPQLPELTREAAKTQAQACDAAQVFAEHADYVWNTLRRLGAPPAELEDMTHDTFLAVFRAWDDYDPTRPLRPWLFVFALRVVSGYRRRARHRFEVAEAREASDSAPNAVELLLQKERLAWAHEALQDVALSRRSVFILHELDGCSIPEVAAALAIPVATAYSRLRLAREDFAASIKRRAARAR